MSQEAHTQMSQEATTFSFRKIAIVGFMHIIGIIGLVRLIQCQDMRFVYAGLAVLYLGGMGITAGAHRLWAHRTYKATPLLKYFLIFCNTIALQGSVISWSLDHRLHHIKSETDEDPHNFKQGFFYAHMGWILINKPKKVIEAGKKVHMTDLREDPALMFQHKHYGWLGPLISIGLPTLIFGYLLGSYSNAYFITCGFRIVIVWHFTWFVNSLAHFVGEKPYNSTIGPVENSLVALLTFGEGWHNYHHEFPNDYKAAETILTYNPTAWFIQLCAFLGLAYDLKEAKREQVQERLANPDKKSL